MIKKLAKCIREYKTSTALSLIFITLEAVFECVIPFITARLVNQIEAGIAIKLIIWTGAILVMITLASFASGVIAGISSARASAGFSKNLRKDMFYNVQTFSFSNIDKFSTASIITRLTTDITTIQNAFMTVTRMLARSPFMLVGATIMAIKINAQLALVFIIAIPVLGAALVIISTKAFPRFKSMFKKYDALNASVQENLTSVRVVKAYVREEHENEKFGISADNLRKAQVAAERLIICNMPFMQFVMYACMIAISYFGGNMIMAGSMDAGELMSFISYVSQILMSLMMISFAFVGLVMSRASIARIVEVLDEEIDITDRECDENLTVKDGSVEFENVSFSYSKNKDNYNVENINLKIKSGETVGIIGSTGSAKTTLVSLIPRLYDVCEGRVLVGGYDVRDYKIKNLRDAVSMVLQKNVLFSGSILENLRWGDLDATDKEIENACKDACAHDFVTSFPDGYLTDLGQGGVNVSGGQKQRLTIARALLKKPKILILDDSTSAVDTNTDAKIREAFKKQDDTTVIIIAQRISSVCDADKIIVLDDGKIAQIGTHDELINKDGIYKELYTLQTNQ